MDISLKLGEIPGLYYVTEKQNIPFVFLSKYTRLPNASGHMHCYHLNLSHIHYCKILSDFPVFSIAPLYEILTTIIRWRLSKWRSNYAGLKIVKQFFVYSKKRQSLSNPTFCDSATTHSPNELISFQIFLL